MRANTYLSSISGYSLFYEAVAARWVPPSKSPPEMQEAAKGILIPMYEVCEVLTHALHWQAKGLAHAN